MISGSPIFSIIIPTYNRAQLISRTIDSILRQDFTDFEVLVIDDGSTDNTERVVREFADTRIQYFKKENAERGAARNYGAIRARGTYLNFFDSDDIMYHNHLSAARKFLDQWRKPEFFHLGYDYKLEDGTLLKKVNDFDEGIQDAMLFDNRLSCNGVFLRKDIAEKFNFEEDRDLASSEDWELWIRMVSRFKLHYSNEITSSVINHDQRSLRTIPAKRVVVRDLLFIEKLRQDPVVRLNYGRMFSRFVAERYTFFMLSFAEQKQQAEVWKWGMRAFLIHPLILGSKRFLASIKNSILK
ncbi:MAG: glycosyltransferase family A protein [Bacteroidota bacterium]